MISQLISGPTSALGELIQIDGLYINFPYVPYECQRDFMVKVVGALNSNTNGALESPTGTGKTLSLLCSAIAWVQRQKENIKPQPFVMDGMTNPSGSGQQNSSGTSSSPLYPKIYYASRTHSQLQQVIRELNKTTYRSAVRVATLAGRDHLCLNEKVLKENNSELRGHICRAMTRTRKCHYYNRLEKDADLLDVMYAEEAKGRAIDIEDLLNISRKFSHCPFYRSRQMYEKADLILLPYNYILDPKMREIYEIRIKGNILIFDEAHNMQAAAEESVSVDFSTKTLSVAIQETKKVLQMVMDEEEEVRQQMDDHGESFASMMSHNKKKSKRENEEQKDKLSKEDVSCLLLMIQSFEEQIDSLDLEKGGTTLPNLPGRVFPGRKLIELMKLADINRHQREQICTLIDRIGLFLAKNADKNSGVWAVRGTSLSEFSKLISRVFVDTYEGFRSPLNCNQRHQQISTSEYDVSSNFQLFIEKNCQLDKKKPKYEEDDENFDDLKKQKGKEIKFHYWCFNAGVAMRLLESRGTRSILLASGTLAPLNTFLDSMGISFGAILESAHCAREEQLIVGALENGPGKIQLLGTFKNRDALHYQKSIGLLILQVARVTLQGMLVFFPSYFQMAKFIECWKAMRLDENEGGQPYWPILERQKQIFTEPKDKSDVRKLFREFDAAIRQDSRGALLFAVCRGKLSEGIDFADSHCRSIIIVGIPFPPLYDPRVMLKKEYLTQQFKLRLEEAKTNKDPNISNAHILGKAQTADDWYKIEGIRAVNQALGRIIRHKDDFGAVILADLRFAKMDRRMYPSWMRPSVKVHANPSSLVPSIQRFFTSRGMEKKPQSGEDRKRQLGELQLANLNGNNVQQMGSRRQQQTGDWKRIKYTATINENQSPSQPLSKSICSSSEAQLFLQMKHEKKRLGPKIRISDNYFDDAES